MKIDYGNGRREYGPGVLIQLEGDEVASAIDSYLVAHGVYVSGARTISVNGKLIDEGEVYVDPSGFVITPEWVKLSGRGGATTKPYLLKAWGADQKEAAKLYHPESTHDGSLHWWFATAKECNEFKCNLHAKGFTLMTAVYPDEDEYSDTHKRTVAVIDFKLPSGEIKHLEHYFGYGYPPSAAEYMFRDGNYSCDCNRSILLDMEEMPCGDTIEMISFTTKEED